MPTMCKLRVWGRHGLTGAPDTLSPLLYPPSLLLPQPHTTLQTEPHALACMTQQCGLLAGEIPTLLDVSFLLQTKLKHTHTYMKQQCGMLPGESPTRSGRKSSASVQT
jgi:hypothetical protein